jgi:RNA polymerase primary sigma factor
MEAQLKPAALERFAEITDLFRRFEKIQAERLDVLAIGNDFPAAKSQYQKLREDLTAQVESVQFHASKIEYLVDNLYAFNRRLTALGGQMLRLAERHKVSRKDFLDNYVGRELDDGWLQSLAGRDKNGPPLPPTKVRRWSASAPRSPTSRPPPACRWANSAAS